MRQLQGEAVVYFLIEAAAALGPEFGRQAGAKREVVAPRGLPFEMHNKIAKSTGMPICGPREVQRQFG